MRMAELKAKLKTEDNESSQRCEESGNFPHCLREYKMVQPL
jgi:hypothetical protein